MIKHSLTISLKTAEETTAYAIALAPELCAGDSILLIGDVGSGKTHFARAIIQALLEVPEDVPSPTFTLVQTYEAAETEIWHADLYRLTSVFEIEELGLTEAFDTAICLVEWPDRMGELTPSTALTLTFTHGDEEGERHLSATWDAPRWQDKLAVWH